MQGNAVVATNETVKTNAIGAKMAGAAQTEIGARFGAQLPSAATVNTTAAAKGAASIGAHATASLPASAKLLVEGTHGSTVSAVAKGGALTAKVGATSGTTAATAVKGGILGAKVSLAAKAMAVVGVSVAGVAIAASTGAAPGLQVALSHVPVWTHAHSVLTTLSTSIRGHLGGSAGVAL